MRINLPESLQLKDLHRIDTLPGGFASKPYWVTYVCQIPFYAVFQKFLGLYYATYYKCVYNVGMRDVISPWRRRFGQCRILSVSST